MVPTTQPQSGCVHCKRLVHIEACDCPHAHTCHCLFTRWLYFVRCTAVPRRHFLVPALRLPPTASPHPTPHPPPQKEAHELRPCQRASASTEAPLGFCLRDIGGPCTPTSLRHKGRCLCSHKSNPSVPFLPLHRVLPPFSHTLPPSTSSRWELNGVGESRCIPVSLALGFWSSSTTNGGGGASGDNGNGRVCVGGDHAAAAQ